MLGYVAETRSQTDRRSISYDATRAGLDALRKAALFEKPLAGYSQRELTDLSDSLKLLLQRALHARGNRPFGICRECIHHRHRKDERYCALLDVRLEESEAGEICYEQAS